MDEPVTPGTRPVAEAFPVTCPFGRKARPGQKTWKGGVHRGVDFGTPKRTPVRAWKAGATARAGDYGDGFGIYARIDHEDGICSYYTHLDAVFCKEGAYVAEGEVIGLSGNTGNVVPKPTPERPDAGAHLHFEVRRGGVAVAPAWRDA